MRADQAHTLPRQFRRIRLELAREPGHPDGDRGIGYTIVAPLQPDGRLDVDLARAHRDDCGVLRFKHDADVEEGHLRRRPGGSWSFHYDLPDDSEDDDAAYRLETHRFVPGEYVTIAEDDAAHTYRVISVSPL
ncbi:MAG: hypothetical protein HY054_02430 [Proteobacteria bacterium]|nr:hypothetical protein [Pseudomonadota bacterium]